MMSVNNDEQYGGIVVALTYAVVWVIPASVSTILALRDNDWGLMFISLMHWCAGPIAVLALWAIFPRILPRIMVKIKRVSFGICVNTSFLRLPTISLAAVSPLLILGCLSFGHAPDYRERGMILTGIGYCVFLIWQVSRSTYRGDTVINIGSEGILIQTWTCFSCQWDDIDEIILKRKMLFPSIEITGRIKSTSNSGERVVFTTGRLTTILFGYPHSDFMRYVNLYASEKVSCKNRLI